MKDDETREAPKVAKNQGTSEENQVLAYRVREHNTKRHPRNTAVRATKEH